MTRIATECGTSVDRALEIIRNGRLVAIPTETVYGLGADAEREEAVSAIYRTKGRPTDHPLIVHIAQAQDARHFADPIPDFAWALMNAHWPGPLTLILPRRAHVATGSAAGQASIGLRCPSHPVAQALLRAARGLGVHGVGMTLKYRLEHRDGQSLWWERLLFWLCWISLVGLAVWIGAKLLAG